jgi:uncharacterized protein YndB with AHSA1/START domain
MTNNFVFEYDLAAKTIHLSREFNAPVEKVWRAFTEPALIDQWLGPKPYKVVTKIMEFKVGGIWLYAMVGPDGPVGWSRAEFTEIENGSYFSSINMFSDEDGNTVAGAPKSNTTNKFLSIEGNRTKVDVVKIFTDEATVKIFVEMGFKEGTVMGYTQLDEILASE